MIQINIDWAWVFAICILYPFFQGFFAELAKDVAKWWRK